jgi:Ca-activated chloride channel homolog
MKRLITACVITVAMVFSCVRMNGAQAPDPSSQPTSSSAAIIPPGHIFIMQLDTSLHTHTTKKGDKVEFHTAADVIVDNQILIPNQSLIRGEVKKSQRAGLLFGRAELQLRFVDVKLPDGTMLPFQAIITRAGFDPVDSKKGEDPKIQGETGTSADVKTAASAGAQGAIVGILYGGPRGAIYGAVAGVAATVIGGMFRRGPDIDLPRRTMFEARFEKPLEIPAQSVLAQNSPAAKSEAITRTAALDTPMDEPVAKGRPVLRRPQNTQPPEEASISKPASDAGAPGSDTPEDESLTRARPVLRRQQSAQSTDEASVSKSEPVAATPPTVPREEVTPAEPVAEGIKISVKVKMVQVDTVARDRSGRVMADLRLEDFRVYEDNVLQELAGFSQDELPLAVALVVDRSDSVAPYISELRRIAIRALYNLKQQDEVCLFSFAADVQRMQDLTTDRQRIADSIDRIRAGGNTDIMDALHDAIRYLANAAPDSRHAIILVSDNQQTAHPMVSEHEVITTAQEKDTVVYSLKTSGTLRPLGTQLPSLILGDSVNKVAQETGGEVIKVSNVGSLDNALSSIISRLRTRYSLGYYASSSSQSGAFHSITVRLADKFGKPGSDYFIHAKRGYYSVQSSKFIADTQP